MARKDSFPSSSMKKVTKKVPGPSKPIKSTLSTEFIQDSDESEVEASSKPDKKERKESDPAKPKGKSVTTSVRAKKAPKKTTESSKERRATSPSPRRLSPNRNGALKATSSQSTTEDDSETSSASRDSTPTPAKRKISFSSPADDELRKTADNAKSRKRPGSVAPSLSSGTTKDHSGEKVKEEDSSESDESGGNSSTESESESSEELSPSRKPRKASPKQSDVSLPPPYEPPSGFKSASITIHPSSKISEIFTPSNLKGKQIWHITAPISVPIESIKEVSAQNIQNGASVLSHKGTQYGLAPETGGEHVTRNALLLPSVRDNEYRSSTTPITNTLHLQQLVNLPNRTHELSGLSSLRPRTHVKNPRQQPEGLKMRYHAFGASEDSDSDASETPAFHAPEFRMPKKIEHDLSGKKRNRSTLESGETTPAAISAKRKKQNLRPEDPHETIDTSRRANGQANGESITKGFPNGKPEPEMNGLAANDDTPSKKKKRKKDDNLNDQENKPASSQSLLPADLSKEAETIMPDEVVNHDMGINRISPENDPKEDKAKRKEARRKHRGMELTTPRKEPLANLEDLVQHHSRNISKTDSVPSLTPKPSSAKTAPTTQGSQTKFQGSSQSTPGKETKEERAKRKEEKRKRQVASDFY